MNCRSSEIVEFNKEVVSLKKVYSALCHEADLVKKGIFLFYKTPGTQIDLSGQYFVCQELHESRIEVLTNIIRFFKEKNEAIFNKFESKIKAYFECVFNFEELFAAYLSSYASFFNFQYDVRVRRPHFIPSPFKYA